MRLQLLFVSKTGKEGCRQWCWSRSCRPEEKVQVSLKYLKFAICIPHSIISHQRLWLNHKSERFHLLIVSFLSRSFLTTMTSTGNTWTGREALTDHSITSLERSRLESLFQSFLWWKSFVNISSSSKRGIIFNFECDLVIVIICEKSDSKQFHHQISASLLFFTCKIYSHRLHIFLDCKFLQLFVSTLIGELYSSPLIARIQNTWLEWKGCRWSPSLKVCRYPTASRNGSCF